MADEIVDRLFVPGDYIQKLIETKLGPALEGEPVGPASIALIALTAMVLEPEIPLDRLQEVVMTMSQQFALALMDTPPNSKVN
jgi:hypothetical protein